MDYKLKVLSIYELGQRKNQEDYIYPPIGVRSDDDRLFIVCDGMGGHEKGEVASKAVCEKLSEYIRENYDREDVFTEEVFNAALAYAYDALDALDDGAEKKMGTTLTFLMFHNDGCFLAHIGDSRIYHIRPSEDKEERIQYVTRDHSLVNDLVSIGEMTAEEAKTSKQKNIITRAMQPNQERRSKADVYHVEDVRPGDYFYMCSDGMLEQAEDVEIANVISMSNKSDEEKLEMFRALTKDNKDNHSAHLIKVLSTGSDAVALSEDRVPAKGYATVIVAFVLALLLCVGYIFRDDIKKVIQSKSENKEVSAPAKERHDKPAPAVKPEPVEEPVPDMPADPGETPAQSEDPVPNVVSEPDPVPAIESDVTSEVEVVPGEQIPESTSESTVNDQNVKLGAEAYKAKKKENMMNDVVEQTQQQIKQK